MIVIDSSAIVAVFLKEPGFAQLLGVMRDSHRPHVSAANLLEVLMVLDGCSGTDNRGLMQRWLDRLDIAIEPVTARPGRPAPLPGPSRPVRSAWPPTPSAASAGASIRLA